jgi:hypothetical protein
MDRFKPRARSFNPASFIKHFFLELVVHILCPDPLSSSCASCLSSKLTAVASSCSGTGTSLLCVTGIKAGGKSAYTIKHLVLDVRP